VSPIGYTGCGWRRSFAPTSSSTGLTAFATGAPSPGSLRASYGLADGNPGDVKPVGEGVSEMRIDYGAGYRVYFISRGEAVVLLLCGGDKRTQDRDIAQAKKLAKDWKE
jgi:putative addiction module killer protein